MAKKIKKNKSVITCYPVAKGQKRQTAGSFSITFYYVWSWIERKSQLRSCIQSSIVIFLLTKKKTKKQKLKKIEEKKLHSALHNP